MEHRLQLAISPGEVLDSEDHYWDWRLVPLPCGRELAPWLIRSSAHSQVIVLARQKRPEGIGGQQNLPEGKGDH